MGLQNLEIKDPRKKVVTQISETLFLFNTIFPPNREVLMKFVFFFFLSLLRFLENK